MSKYFYIYIYIYKLSISGTNNRFTRTNSLAGNTTSRGYGRYIRERMFEEVACMESFIKYKISGGRNSWKMLGMRGPQ